ncbi:MAG: hypothetical protein FJZ13_04260, partial [Candidatus Omnitrophica bacterium]|nr:hypothetical protein [Candidatus Omnitrophota bacterium]
MIEINLIPQELKAKAKKIGIETDYLRFLIPLALGLVACAHIYLLLAGIIKSYKLCALNHQWQKSAPQRKALDDFKKEHNLFSADAKALQELSNKRIKWSEKLNRLSLDLPAGIWFNEIALTPKTFTLKGSVISLEKQEIGVINRFIGNLKGDAAFFK